jgi:hypothetical protein
MDVIKDDLDKEALLEMQGQKGGEGYELMKKLAD